MFPVYPLFCLCMSQPMHVYTFRITFFGKMTALGVLHCFALLFDLACFFFPSHLSLKHV